MRERARERLSENGRLKEGLVSTVQLKDGFLVVDYEGEYKFKPTKGVSENVKKLTIKHKMRYKD